MDQVGIAELRKAEEQATAGSKTRKHNNRRLI